MSANAVGSNLTQYLGRGGLGKIKANSSNVLQIANRCGAVAELAAGTYTIPTLGAGQTFFYFWVKASGAVTLTGVGSLATNESAVVLMDGTGWAMLSTNILSTLTTTQGFIDLPLAGWREVFSNDIGVAAVAAAQGSGGILATDTTPTLEYVNGDTDSQIRMLWAAANVDKVTRQLTLPPDLDRTANMILYIRGKMNDVNDSPAITVESFFDEGDTKVSDTSEPLSDEVSNWSATIAAADIPDTATTMSIELTPGAHGTDTLAVYATYLTYTKKLLTS